MNSQNCSLVCLCHTPPSSRVDHVTPVVAGIMPAAMVVERPASAGTRMIRADAMARGVAISISEIDGTAATLAVKGAHCSLQR